ncbi:MAG: hydrogenase iron-sulfur subunit, partial [Chloroflexi bacterium]|nr:hydrogenase iron-sulfur subunit [Chloroflexota bacterium]
LLAYSEVEEVSGYVGNFRARVRRKARYVKENECTACGDCAKVCPVVSMDEFQTGLSTRRAIYIPFPQAVPSAYVINMQECLGYNPIACGKCLDACEKKCIDFDMRDEILELQVGAIIVATGMDTYDPTELDEYGYTRYENVITSLEFERLISAGGPTGGHFVRPKDQVRPRRIGFIQCVGSRSEVRGNPYCSNICCMNTIKDSLLLKDHYPDTDITVFYLDIRAFGKGFEDLYRRSKEAGVRYIRGLPGEVTEINGSGDLRLVVENTTTGRLETHEFDLVVLSIGAIPRRDSETVRKLLTLSRARDGFFLEAHPKLKPVDTPTRGVFLAGCAESPKDIKESVTQASAAAARAEILLSAGEIKLEALTAVVDRDLCTGCGACTRVCPYGAITQPAKKEPVQVVAAACAGCGTCAAECRFGAITMRHFTDQQIYAQLDAALAEKPAETIVVFACNWCSYAGADTAGTSRFQYPPNARVIRTMCSGRVNEDFVLYAFRKGAPIVLVSGCHYADCHYINANRQTQRRVDRLWDRLERLGVRPERLQLEWISAAEGSKWAQVMTELETMRQKVTMEEIEQTIQVLTAEEAKKKRKVGA